MGTRRETTTSQQQQQSFNQQAGRIFDPTSLGIYRGLQPGVGNVLSSYMNDPYSSAFFNLNLQRGLAGNQAIGNRMIGNLQQNILAGGFGGGAGNIPAFQQAMLNRISMQRGGMDAATQQNLLLGFEQLRRQATGMAMGYQPLETGQTTAGASQGQMQGRETQTMSGFGTWLPQLAGSAIGLALGPAGPFGSFGSMFGGSPQATTNWGSQNAPMYGYNPFTMIPQSSMYPGMYGSNFGGNLGSTGGYNFRP